MKKLKKKLKNIKNLTINDIDAKSIYIHIPFCEHICSYCDFNKILYNDEIAFLYVNKLIEDLDYIISLNLRFKTIYVGGGTPTSLSDELLDKLFNKIEKIIDYNEDFEFTVEANVENLTLNKLEIFNKYYVNRISIGVQTFNDEILKIYNRKHSSTDALNKIKETKKYISNINIDLIYGSTFEDFEILKNDLEIISSLPINHISLYSLQINDGTIFSYQKIKELDGDKIREQYDYIVSYLKKLGFIHYEISNFAKEGYESKHNITYWRDGKYLALGAGASGYLSNFRYKNVKNPLSYINKEEIFEIEEVSHDDDYEYYLITNLRLLSGFSIDEINKKFSIDFIKDHLEKINLLKNKGLIDIQNGRFFCTENGIFVLDSIILELL